MAHSTFHTTHWSVVLAAKGDDTKARAALAELCKSYREPIVRHIERAIRTDSASRYGGRSAEDLTHDFLIQLLEGKLFELFQRREGRFRAYILQAVRYFLSHVREQELSAKRGGKFAHVPIDGDIAMPHEDTLFDRDWAQTTINRAIVSLGNTQEIQMLRSWLTSEMTAEDRLRLATELGKSEGAIKVALHRLRKKLRQHIREQIAHTVETEAEIGAELDYLIRVLVQH